MNAAVMRRILAALFVFGAGLAHAQELVNATPPSPAQSLSCLQKPTGALSFPERDKYDHAQGAMRVRLSFNRPDAKPEVEVLTNTAREDMQDEVFRRLAKYRLPCLTPADGVVQAVQEFLFNNSDRDPVPFNGSKGQPLCIVMPRHDMGTFEGSSRDTEHVMVAVVFDGDGQKEPAVRVLFSTGNVALERFVTARARQYRAPCRTASDSAWIATQHFHLNPEGRRYVLTRESFGLGEFLSMTVGIRELDADFDTRTMNCPFKVSYQALAPSMPNEVGVAGEEPDPNRAVFLQWLSERQLGFKDDKQRRDLFGSVFQITVPCGKLTLHPKAAAAPAPAASASG